MPSKKSRKASSKTSSNTDKNRTVEEWGEFPTVTLREKLSLFDLPTNGKKRTLQERLFEHFNPPAPKQNNNIQLSDILTQVQAMRADIDLLKSKNTQSTINIPVSEQQQRQRVDFVQQEFRVPSSRHQQSTKSKQIQSPNSTITQQIQIDQPQQQTETVNVDELYSDEETQQQQSFFGFTQPTYQNINSTGMFMNSSTNNPYAPPGIKASILTKVKRNDYVDFDEILPPPPSINSNPELLGFQFDSNNNLLLKPANQTKAKIRDYPSWICAWNIYQQAVLHFHPDKHFELFSYFKILTNLARKHRFENVYLYDRSQRQTLAAQSTLPEISRTVNWKTVNEELYNNFLREAHLPSCYNCATFGHYASACPFKPKTTPKYSSPYTFIADRTFRNDSQTITSQSQIRQGNNQPQNRTGVSNQQDICQRFNHNNGACNKPPCRYLHICNKCFSPNHPGSKCTASTGASNTRTSFRPSTN